MVAQHHANGLWICRALVATIIGLACLTTNTLAVDSDKALYVGGSLKQLAPPPVGRAEAVAGTLLGGVAPPPKIEGRIILTSDRELGFDMGRRGRLAIPYKAITSLEYGLESSRHTTKERGFVLILPWDSTEQFTHNLLTIAYRDESMTEQAIVLELGKNLVRPALEMLERHTGTSVTFLNVEACMVMRNNREACGYGQPDELKSLRRVFIDPDVPPGGRKVISSAVENSGAGLEIVETLNSAEIILRFRSQRSRDPNCPCEGGRGEVLLVRGEQHRVVLVFTGMKKGLWGKNPTEDFGRTFVNAVRAANGLRRLSD